MACINQTTYISAHHNITQHIRKHNIHPIQPDSHSVSQMQVKSGLPQQTATVATVIGGLIGIGALAYVGLKL